MAPNWPALWEDSFVRIRDQLRGERFEGHPKRLGMRERDDSAIDRYAREEASRRAEGAIIRHNEKLST